MSSSEAGKGVGSGRGVSRRPVVGGNWKMNTDCRTGPILAAAVHEGLRADVAECVEVVVFPPMCYLMHVGATLAERGSPVKLGAQNLWHEDNGAYTGEVSARMLADCGASYVLIGHSERRHVVGETDELIGKKLRAAVAGGLRAVLCVGETLAQREAGETDAVNERQLRSALAGVHGGVCGGSGGGVGGGGGGMERVVIAYEPVWAIGTGKTATPEDAQRAHEQIRSVLAGMFDRETADRTPIQYGGSVKPSNAAELFAMPDIDGGLIGGASLEAETFLSIVNAAGV